MDMLRNQLATMLIILQAINNLQETVLPFLTNLYYSKVINNFIAINYKINNFQSFLDGTTQRIYI